MKFQPSDAPSHTAFARTPLLRYVWAEVANEALDKGAKEAAAILKANAAVKAPGGPR
jgi:hypothetical protein